MSEHIDSFREDSATTDVSTYLAEAVQAKNPATTRRATNVETSKSTTFHFLELSPELRKMIYKCYYESKDPLLKYFVHRGAHATLPGRMITDQRVDQRTAFGQRYPHLSHILTGIPASSLHQVSRQLVSEATPFWRQKLERLVIQTKTRRICPISSFCNALAYLQLRNHLTELVLTMELHEFDISRAGIAGTWPNLVKSCPKLDKIEIIFVDTWDSSYMSTDSGEIDRKKKDLKRTVDVATGGNDGECFRTIRGWETKILAWLLELRAKEKYGLYVTFRDIGYDDVEGHRHFPRSDRRTLTKGDEELFEDSLGLVKTFDVSSTFKITPDRYKPISRDCHIVEEDIRIRWRLGMEAPMMNIANSGEWSPLTARFIDGYTTWCLPQHCEPLDDASDGSAIHGGGVIDEIFDDNSNEEF